MEENATEMQYVSIFVNCHWCDQIFKGSSKLTSSKQICLEMPIDMKTN